MSISKSFSAVLSIAGSDSSAGAGIQADLKAFNKLGFHGLTVVTSITAQNTKRISRIQHIEEAMIYEQIDMLQKDIKIKAVKIGMLATQGIVETVVKAIEDFQLKKLVLDPVMTATSGDKLMSNSAVDALKQILLPKVDIITPNIFEAEALTSLKIKSLKDMEEAAERIVKMGVSYALVKGGHLMTQSPQRKSIDIMCDSRGIRNIRHFASEYLTKARVHGTGCAFSAALTAYLALEHDIPTAVAHAKSFISRGIQYAYPIGQKKGKEQDSLVVNVM